MTDSPSALDDSPNSERGDRNESRASEAAGEKQGAETTARMLVIDDDRSVLHIFNRLFANTGITVHTAGTAAQGIAMVKEHKPDVVVLDIKLPDRSGLETFEDIRKIDPQVPVIFITAAGGSGTAIEAMKLGAYDYLVKPLDAQQVRSLVSRAIEIRRFMHVPVEVTDVAAEEDSCDFLVGRSNSMQEVYKGIGRVAPQDVTVLIRGESGTGKELVARAIYQHSLRAKGPFLAVNCAAIPEALLESELFGHERGSFTGAEARRIGKFEQSHGGTLFMDEIGDMTPLVQSKVLRLLQDQQFERVGGNQTIKTDVRIIAATNRDLDAMVAKGEFRPDLYYRLNGFVISIPPLRERSDDVLLLLTHFLKRFSKDLSKEVHGISPEALEVLLRYPWPGNVRELQSVLKRALLQATGPVLISDFLPEQLRQQSGSMGNVAVPGPAGLETFIDSRIRDGSEDLYAEAVALLEKSLITRVLQHTSGNQSHAAKILGITRGSLRNKIRLSGISIEHVVSADANGST